MGKKSRMKKERQVSRQPGGATQEGNPDSKGPPADRRALEREMANLHRLLAEQQFGSPEEAQQFMRQMLSKSGGRVPSRPARSPVEQAQDIMYEAWDAQGAQRAALAHKALEVCNDCADAYVLLAEETATTAAEARDLYAQGVAAGERALGERMFKENAGEFWGILETRPYMRARLGLAQCLWALGEREAALDHYADMLRMNPNDNQGVRYPLVTGLLVLGRDDVAGKLLEVYPDDVSTCWVYSRALWTFRREGDSPQARRRLRQALEQNRYVPDYLRGRKPIPQGRADYVRSGDEGEAGTYAADAYELWQQTPGALDWLAAAG